MGSKGLDSMASTFQFKTISGVDARPISTSERTGGAVSIALHMIPPVRFQLAAA
jgi:hypothetical protein